MHILTLSFLACAASSLLTETVQASPLTTRQEDPDAFVGYLISTFSDPTPQVQWHLSAGNDPYHFTPLNAGAPVLTSDVGTGGVRDIFLAADGERGRWFTIATGTLTYPLEWFRRWALVLC